jgi:hypothetical protein
MTEKEFFNEIKNSNLAKSDIIDYANDYKNRGHDLNELCINLEIENICAKINRESIAEVDKTEKLWNAAQTIKKKFGITDVTTNGTHKPQPMQSIIPDDILTKLEKNGFITQNPLEWIGQKNLCAYFVDIYFKNNTKKWAIGMKLFKVKNLAQLKDLYQNSKSGKPKNKQLIDTILQ